MQFGNLSITFSILILTIIIFFKRFGFDVIQFLYNDPSIKVYFEALGGLPKNLSSNNLISFTAKFPY